MKQTYEFFSKIVGSTFCHGAQDAIKTLVPNQKLIAVPEPDNKYDANAIAIYLNDNQRLGYIPRDTARGLKEDIDNGKTIEITVSEVTGMSTGKDNVGCNIFVTIYENL
jgi:hypothetical protein